MGCCAIKTASEKEDLLKEKVDNEHLVQIGLEGKLKEMEADRAMRKLQIENSTVILQKLMEEKAQLLKQKQDGESSYAFRSSQIKEKISKLEEDVKVKSAVLENLRSANENMKVNLEELRLSNEDKASVNSKLESSIAITEKERDDLINLASKKKLELEKLSTACDDEDRIERDLEMIRADLRFCEEKRKMTEREVSSYENIEHQKVGLEKEKENRRNRNILLKEKEDNYVQTLSLVSSQLAELQVKEDSAHD